MEIINRDNAGKIFFAIGVVICLFMFVSKASWSILHVDEYWTYSREFAFKGGNGGYSK